MNSIDALKAIAHPTRFAILETLRGTERNVGEIEAASGIGQPALSQQLAVLRNAALVTTRKEAKQVYYRLDDTKLAQIADLIQRLAGERRPAEDSPVMHRPSPGAAHFARLAQNPLT